MNKLLYRVMAYMLFAIFISLIAISSIQQQLINTGSFFGYEILKPKEIIVFYHFINDYVTIRSISEEQDLSDLTVHTFEVLDPENKYYDIVGVYYQNGEWSQDSQKNIDLTKALKIHNRNNNPVAQILLPSIISRDNYLISAKTQDHQIIYVVMHLKPLFYEVLSKCSHAIYKLQFVSILIALIVTFLPVAFSLAWSYIIPLKRLQKAADTIADGQLDFNIRTHGLDEIKDLSKSLESMRHELEESKQREQRLKDNHRHLIANMSHDLKTPITSIKGYVEAIIDGKGHSPERLDRYLKTIQSKTTYLDTMINDLFLFSQLDLGEYTLDQKVWESNEFIKIITEPIQLWIEDSGWTFEIKTPIPRTLLYVDIHRLSQVIENVVQNSLKYAPSPGTFTIETDIRNHYFAISLIDSGIGISEKALPFIFEPFYREDGSRSHKAGGSGLGLSICKKIIELHGGRVYAESEHGNGTKIVLMLPLRQYDPKT